MIALFVRLSVDLSVFRDFRCDDGTCLLCLSCFDFLCLCAPFPCTVALNAWNMRSYSSPAPYLILFNILVRLCWSTLVAMFSPITFCSRQSLTPGCGVSFPYGVQLTWTIHTSLGLCFRSWVPSDFLWCLFGLSSLLLIYSFKQCMFCFYIHVCKVVEGSIQNVEGSIQKTEGTHAHLASTVTAYAIAAPH